MNSETKREHFHSGLLTVSLAMPIMKASGYKRPCEREPDASHKVDGEKGAVEYCSGDTRQSCTSRPDRKSQRAPRRF